MIIIIKYCQTYEPVILKFEPRICRFKSLNKQKMVWEDVLQESTMEFMDKNKQSVQPEIFDSNNLPF